MSDVTRYGDNSFDLSKVTPQTRLGNREKQFLDALLNKSVESGYLDLDEYQDRVDKILAAKTVGEAEVVLVDLPLYQQLLAGPPEKEEGTPTWIKWVWFGLGLPMGITTGIWGVIYFLTGSNQYFWPAFVLVPLMVVGLGLTIAERAMIRPWWKEQKRKERLRKAERRQTHGKRMG